MPQGKERRKHPRVKVTIPAVISVDQSGQRYGGEVQEISEGGARISSSAPMAEIRGQITIKMKMGEAVLSIQARIVDQDAVEYELPDEINQTAVIRWASSRGDGVMGIEFQNLDEKTRKVIRKLVKHLLAAGQESD